MGPLDVAASLAHATRDMRAPQDLDTTLDTIVRAARESIPGVDEAGISLALRTGGLETRVASADVVGELDLVQQQVGEGPSLQMLDADVVVRVDDATSEQRWARFMPEAVERGVRSVLVVRLHGDAQTRGVLTLYSRSAHALSQEAEQLAELFAAHAGLAIGHARQIENLNAALTSRKLIGLALGMLMQRLDLDEDSAFAYLTRVSASTETKLRDVAASVVQEHYERLATGDRTRHDLS